MLPEFENLSRSAAERMGLAGWQAFLRPHSGSDDFKPPPNGQALRRMPDECANVLCANPFCCCVPEASDTRVWHSGLYCCCASVDGAREDVFCSLAMCCNPWYIFMYTLDKDGNGLRDHFFGEHGQPMCPMPCWFATCLWPFSPCASVFLSIRGENAFKSNRRDGVPHHTTRVSNPPHVHTIHCSASYPPPLKQKQT